MGHSPGKMRHSKRRLRIQAFRGKRARRVGLSLENKYVLRKIHGPSEKREEAWWFVTQCVSPVVSTSGLSCGEHQSSRVDESPGRGFMATEFLRRNKESPAKASRCICSFSNKYGSEYPICPSGIFWRGIFCSPSIVLMFSKIVLEPCSSGNCQISLKWPNTCPFQNLFYLKQFLKFSYFKVEQMVKVKQ